MQHAPMRLREETVDVTAALRSAAATTDPQRRTLLQTLTLELPALAIDITADPVRIEQIFANLLANASKATPRRGRHHAGAGARAASAGAALRSACGCARSDGVGTPDRRARACSHVAGRRRRARRARR